MWNFMKIRVDGRTDMKLIVASHHFGNAPKTNKTKRPTCLNARSTVAATCTNLPFCQHNSQDHYFIWQLSVVTSCRFVYRIDVARSAERPNTQWNCSMKWPESRKQGSSVTTVNKRPASLTDLNPDNGRVRLLCTHPYRPCVPPNLVYYTWWWLLSRI